MRGDWRGCLVVVQEAGWLSQEARCEGAVRVRIARARAWIEAHYALPLDLDLLAQQACYSPYHFLRRYRQVYGVTPHQDLTQRRLWAARRLLEETDRPITDICFAVGFHSVGSFSTLFKRHVGGPPSRWRRRFVSIPFSVPAPPQLRVPFCFLHRFATFEKSASAEPHTLPVPERISSL